MRMRARPTSTTIAPEYSSADGCLPFTTSAILTGTSAGGAAPASSDIAAWTPARLARSPDLALSPFSKNHWDTFVTEDGNQRTLTLLELLVQKQVRPKTDPRRPEGCGYSTWEAASFSATSLPSLNWVIRAGCSSIKT